MAGNEDRKAKLIAQLAGARKQIDASGAGVRRGIDVSTRLRSSFREHAVVWLGGGLLAGILVTLTVRRPRSIKVSKNAADALPKAGAAALLVAGTKIAFDILRPVLIKWLTSRAAPLAEDLFERYSARPTPSRRTVSDGK